MRKVEIKYKGVTLTVIGEFDRLQFFIHKIIAGTQDISLIVSPEAITEIGALCWEELSA
jgi:hypothetical protein